jgi:hypothetical protein
MSSFVVKHVSRIVPKVTVGHRYGLNGVAFIDVHNEDNSSLPKLLRWITLAPMGVRVKESSNRTIYRIPEGCENITAIVCIGIMYADTPDEYQFLAVEIDCPDLAGDNSPFPYIHQCGKFLS